MSRALRAAGFGGAAVLAALWTLAAMGSWWLLQAGATALETQPPAGALQAVADWSERPWVRHVLDPDEVDALRDGVDWLVGLGGGPAAWLGSALTLLGAALLLIWAGGLLLGGAGILVAWIITRWTLAWVDSAPRAHRASRPVAAPDQEADALSGSAP